MKKIQVPIPQAGKMSSQQVSRYRALMAFQLRAAMMEHKDIARVLKFSSANESRRHVAKGRRLMIDCVIQTVPE